MSIAPFSLPTPPAQTAKRGAVLPPGALAWLLVGALLVARFVLAVATVARPGLQYDETLFVNAATLRVPGDFIDASFHGIPLMVFPYIGALKSWLYAPVFSVFGTSAAAIRVPVVLVVCAGLVLVYLAIRELVNRPVALLAFAALCFDNSVFWLTRDDVGPSAIEFFLKCAGLYCAAAFARTRSLRWVWLLLLTLALGVFNKLNYIWVVNAVAAVSVLVAIQHRAQIREQARAAVAWVGGLAVIYAGFVAYYLGNHIGGIVQGQAGNALGQPWHVFEGGMEYILSGTWYYVYVVGPIGPRRGVVLAVLVLFLAGALASATRGRYRNLPVTGLALVTALIAVQNLLTAQATAGWHYVAVYPFVTVVAAYGVYVLASALLRGRTQVRLALVAAGAAALAYNIALMAKYLDALAAREPTNAAWSTAIYQLSREIDHTPGTIFTADWGISNPLFALHPATRYDEVAFQLAAPTADSLRMLRQQVASTKGPKVFVSHADDKLVFAHVNQNLMREFRGHLQQSSTVNGKDGRPVFVIYRYR